MSGDLAHKGWRPADHADLIDRADFAPVNYAELRDHSAVCYPVDNRLRLGDRQRDLGLDAPG